MRITKHLTEIIISVYEWAESLDPHKVVNEIAWYGGIQLHVAMLFKNKLIDWSISFWTIVGPALLAWLCLFFFKILVKHFVAKYLPGLKKYFHHKDESDD